MRRLIFFLIILLDFNLYSNEEIKVFHTNEIIVVSEDKQIEKSTSIADYMISNIARINYFTLDNLLNEISGVRSVRNSKNEGYFRLRGFDQRQVGVFFDGVPIVNQYDGMVDLSLFSVIPVAKITISKGISSTLYGANNLGGAINFVTDNVFKTNFVEGNISYGSFNKNIGFKASQKVDNFFLLLSVNYLNSNDFNTSYEYAGKIFQIPNSYSKLYSGFAKVVHQLSDDFSHSLVFLYGNGEKGIPPNLESSKPRFWKMPHWTNSIVNYSLNGQIFDNVSFRMGFFVMTTKNIIDSFDDSTYSTQETRSAFNSTQRYAKFGSAATLEFKWKNFEPTKLAFSLHRDIQEQQANTNDPWKMFRSQLLSVSAEQNFSLGLIGGLIGLSYDILTPLYANGSNLRSSEDFLNYQIAFNFSPEHFNFFINYSHKSRFPTLKEFYAEVIGSNKPNPNLRSEFSDNFELGFRARATDNLIFRSSIFASFVKDLIDIVTLEDKSRQFVNIGNVLFAGVELETKYNFQDYTFSLNLNYLKSENRTASSSSKILPLRPEYTLNFTILKKFSFGLTPQLQIQSVFEQYAFNSDKKEYIKLPNYNLLNLTFSYQLLKGFTLNASFLNILDELYYSDWGYPQAGFNLNVGVSLLF